MMGFVWLHRIMRMGGIPSWNIQNCNLAVNGFLYFVRLHCTALARVEWHPDLIQAASDISESNSGSGRHAHLHTEYYGGRTVPKIERLRAGKVARNSFKDARDLQNLARNLQNVACNLQNVARKQCSFPPCLRVT